jgi:hypothetical protein
MINDTPNEDARRNQNVVDFLQIVKQIDTYFIGNILLY